MENFNPCPHREFCGGCKYNGEDYEKVLSEKNAYVLACLEDKGIDTDVYAGIAGRPEACRYRYRNKMEYTFGDLVKDGELTLGMHKLGHFMSIVTVDECQLVDEDFNKILRFTLDFALERGYTKYNKRLHRGLLRNLLLRKGARTKEIVIDIVTTSEAGFDERAWADGLKLLPLQNDIVGIARTINDGLADAVNCDEQHIIEGRDYYFEKLLGLDFRVNLFSFFQTNIDAVEKLYAEAIALFDDIDGKSIFDLYCGTGTISQLIASKAKRVVGIDIVADSIHAAKENAKLNKIENCEFICGDVFEVLDSIETLPDAIIVDPPRVGIRTKAVNKIAGYGVKEIVYVSCNPKTMAIDLVDFENMGYEVKYIKAYDNFVWTKHVETIVLLSKTKA
ncbi:MAG: 23S rRNA (uracil(1939)-C(5))-methyltransferase RlmD [Eubacterium sp.]|nr:23S rRNA (uracil(1939)-C(5))-methyltransferase RlmD [Eubacterium sp.]